MKIGKIDEGDFRSLLMGKFGRRDPSVIVPHRTGVDAGVVDLGAAIPPCPSGNPSRGGEGLGAESSKRPSAPLRSDSEWRS